MTDEQKAKRDWLNRAFCAEKKLNALYDKCKRDKARAERVTQVYGGIDKGKSDTRENGTQKLIDVLTDSIEEYDKYAEEFATIRREVEAVINTFDPVTYSIFYYRHLRYLSLERIAEEMHYNEKTIRRKYIEGLDKMSANVLECPFEM